MKTQIRYQEEVLERFIPISLERLVADLLNTGLLSDQQQSDFKHFSLCYSALFHARAHSQLQHLKQIYRPFNPDRDALILGSSEKTEQISQLKTELYDVLEQANYERLSEYDLNEALNKISPHGVKVSVDFNEFVEVALYYRGSAIHTGYQRDWKRFHFKKQAIDVLIYRRLFVLLQPKNRQQWIEHLIVNKKMSRKKAEKKADVALKALGVNGDHDVIYLKLFKDIPRADLEMLFPNTRVQIRLFDKIKLGVMGGGGTAGGVMATVSKFSASIDPVSAVLAIGGLLGVLWRQVAKIISQRAKYSAILTRNLYFYSLDTNMGALTYIIDSAETEECKEAMLAYFFLITNGQCSREELDDCIEKYIKKQYAVPMDFEIDDGLRKLHQAGLLSEDKEKISAVSVQEALKKLKQQWNTVVTELC